MFARVIPEYSRSMEEADILENAFQIIFAFDEIVALGYRESVNLAQIRTFVEMDSHEEKVYQVSTIYPKEYHRWRKCPLLWAELNIRTLNVLRETHYFRDLLDHKFM